jgi:hypothetical protein
MKPKIVYKQEKTIDKYKITNQKTTFCNFKAKTKKDKLISKHKSKPLINSNEINNISLEEKIINTKTNENEKITIPLEQIYISESNQTKSDINIYTDRDDNESIILHPEDYKSNQSNSDINIYTDSDDNESIILHPEDYKSNQTKSYINNYTDSDESTQ